MLQKEIEELIQRGRPQNQWWRKPWELEGDGNRLAGDRGRTDRPREVIHVIHGGPEGGDSGRERKRWALAAYVGAIGLSASTKRVRREPIVFTDEDLPYGAPARREIMMVSMEIAVKLVHRVMVDTGSSVNILYQDTFEKLGLDRSQLKQVVTPLAGFTGDVVEPEGSIRLRVELGDHPRVRSLELDFVVIGLRATHNVILGRPDIEDLGAIISLEH